jgi:MFS family permease
MSRHAGCRHHPAGSAAAGRGTNARTWSDRFGWRPVILLSCFGQAVDFGIMALAPSIAWLFVGRLLSGASSCSIAATGPAGRPA